jgi:putative transposase
MKRKRFSVEQIVAILKQAELGLPVADLIRQVGISHRRSSTLGWSRPRFANLSSFRKRTHG